MKDCEDNHRESPDETGAERPELEEDRTPGWVLRGWWILPGAVLGALFYWGLYEAVVWLFGN